MWKRRLSWALLVLAAGLVYFFDNNTGTRCFLAAVLFLPLISALLLALPKAAFSAELTVPSDWQRSQPVTGSLVLRRQKGRLSLFRLEARVTVENLLTGEVGGFSVEGSPGRAGERTIPFSLQADHYGKLLLRCEEAQLLDLLGLFTRRVPLSAQTEGVVSPKAFPVSVELGESGDFLQDSLRYSPSRPGYDPSETFRIREYAPGDPLRQIHWKLSEKSDQLLVRDFGLPVVEKVLLLLENNQRDGALSLETLDALLELMTSLSAALLAQGVPHTVGWVVHPEERFQRAEVADPAQLAAAMSQLLASPSAREGMGVAECYRQSFGQAAFAHVAVVTAGPLPDVGQLCRGNRVTQLIPGETAAGLGNWEDGSAVLAWRPEDLRNGQLHLNL